MIFEVWWDIYPAEEIMQNASLHFLGKEWTRSMKSDSDPDEGLFSLEYSHSSEDGELFLAFIYSTEGQLFEVYGDTSVERYVSDFHPTIVVDKDEGRSSIFVWLSPKDESLVESGIAVATTSDSGVLVCRVKGLFRTTDEVVGALLRDVAGIGATHIQKEFDLQFRLSGIDGNSE